MASTIPDSFEYDVHTGAIDCDSDTFYAMLLGASYTPSKAHSRRSDLTAYEVAGSGYTSGGQSVTVTVANDTTNHRTNLTLGGTTWATVTLSAQFVAYYKRRGGAASADELVGVVDNGAAVSPSAGPLVVGASTLRIQNNT